MSFIVEYIDETSDPGRLQGVYSGGYKHGMSCIV